MPRTEMVCITATCTINGHTHSADVNVPATEWEGNRLVQLRARDKARDELATLLFDDPSGPSPATVGFHLAAALLTDHRYWQEQS